MELDMLDQAFEALMTYDWGTDPAALSPIDEAVVATREDPAARRELETRLAEVLTADISRDAKDYVCRTLMVVGTAQSVPALAALLPQPEHSHMARYALERIPAAEAAQALRDALPKLGGELKVGLIGSLGVRRDEAGIPALAALLGETEAAVARAAALALGAIRGADAATVLLQAKTQSAEAARAVTDAALACAEGLLATGDTVKALSVYKRFAGEDQPKHVRLAATRGMLACAGKKD
jgi:HEAT repeat protein